MKHRPRVALVVLAALGCGSPPPASEPTPPAPAPIAAPAAAPRAVAKDYPASRRDDIVDKLHGVDVHDPYRWLEDPAKPEVAAWMKAQDAYTRAHVAQLPGRDALATRLAEVFYFDEISAPVRRADRYFYTRKRKDQEKSVLYWKQGERGAEKLLIDPQTWSTDGSAGLKGFWPSDDGRYLAYNKSEHNADETTMSVLDVRTGKLLADTIPGTKYGDALWTPDSRGFYYVFLPEASTQISVAARPGYAELRYHALGSDPAKDPTIRAATKNPQTFLDAAISHDGRWLFASVQHGWNSIDIYFKDLRARQQTWTTLVEGVDAVFMISAYRDTFYLLTNDGAPRYRVAADPKKPARAAWRELVPQSDATLEHVSVVGGNLVLSYLRDAANEVAVHDLQGKRIRKLDLPPLGHTGDVVGRPDDDAAYVSYTSFTEPQVIYKIAVKRGTVAPWAKVELPIDTSQFTTEQVRYPSKDGTEITMFLVHRKDAVKDGKTPVYMTGYGGFAVSMLPGFASPRSSWAAHAVWLEHGGMVAIPNLRGGGEYGEDWHKAGMLLAKQHVFDDFLAAARYLQTSGWTSPAHMAISGGSNGGLLMGAAITQGPELFKAVVVEVPLLDMVRYEMFGSGATWAPEYGSARDAAQFAALYAYSPYHHVTAGTRYPAVLLSSSDHDDRVDPMHARKFAAALQWATASDAPIWLRIQANAGHSGADMVKQKVEQNADTYAFLVWQLGMK